MNPIANIPIGARAAKSVEVTRELTVAQFHEHMPMESKREGKNQPERK
ncbi:MAG: hypothetical protein ACE5HO_12165 [bacterium]